MRIWKYKLNITDRQTIHMPLGARFLSVQMQGQDCCLWALCDEKQRENEPRYIAIYGTGNPMPDTPGLYISTFQIYGGQLVFHAFEISKETFNGT